MSGFAPSSANGMRARDLSFGYAFGEIASTSTRNCGRTDSGTTSSIEAGRASPRKCARTLT